MKIMIQLECASEEEASALFKRLNRLEKENEAEVFELCKGFVRIRSAIAILLHGQTGSLEKIAAYPASEFYKIRNFGMASFRQVCNFLKAHSVVLRPDWQEVLKSGRFTWNSTHGGSRKLITGPERVEN